MIIQGETLTPTHDVARITRRHAQCARSRGEQVAEPLGQANPHASAELCFGARNIGLEGWLAAGQCAHHHRQCVAISMQELRNREGAGRAEHERQAAEPGCAEREAQ